MKNYSMTFYKIIILIITIFIPIHCIASQLGYCPIIDGSNRLIRNNMQIPNIKNVQIKGIANLYIQQAEENKLIIEAEDNILPTLIQKTTDNTLYIDLDNPLIKPNLPILIS